MRRNAINLRFLLKDFMYIETKIYDKGVLQIQQTMSYKTPEELKEFEKFLKNINDKTALLSLNSNN